MYKNLSEDEKKWKKTLDRNKNLSEEKKKIKLKI